MKLPPLIQGAFLRRYKRFFADVQLPDGEVLVAHTPNTGTLLGCLKEGAPAWVSTADNPARKLRYTWELIRLGRTMVGVNTHLANTLAEEAVRGGVIPELRGWFGLRREVKYGVNSRIDLLLEDPAQPPCYVEVKNVTLVRDGIAEFPDAVSVRAAKHMGELAERVRAGERAAVLFVVQRNDGRVFRPADGIDPTYGEALRAAARAGVQVLAWQARVTTRAIALEQALPVEL